MKVKVIEGTGATGCSVGVRTAAGEGASRRACSTGTSPSPSHSRRPGTVAESRPGPEGR